MFGMPQEWCAHGDLEAATTSGRLHLHTGFFAAGEDICKGMVPLVRNRAIVNHMLSGTL